MKLVRGNSYFLDRNDIDTNYEKLNNNISSKIVIVGGGITGALCAYFFAKENIETILVEKNKISQGSTSITTSLLQYELDDFIIDLEKDYSLNKIMEGYKFGDDALHMLKDIINELNIECDYKIKDCLLYTTDPKKIDKLKYDYEKRIENGFDVDFIDENSTNYDFSFDIKAGVYSKSGGSEIDPVKFTRALIEKIQKMGCKIYEDTEIVDFVHSNNSVILKTKNDNTITCEKVIVATGYDINTFTNKKYCDIYTTYNIVTSPLKEITGWHNHCLIRDGEDPYTYLRTTVDNRIIIGGEDTRFIPELLENKMAEKKYDALVEKFNKLFPQFNYSIDFKYNGAFGTTKDNLPYIGPDPENKNIWYCLGYGANGILFSIKGGDILSKLYKGILSKDYKLVSINRDK
ncbi:FAD-dependent oxidoreductase [Clostridium oceanicum]|uniref:FAD-dependent oxidoreductase n=1 Tax=Clostridium oceanicum TaxID=1543 RepID=A0ABN1JGE4_9CLOT